MPLDKVVAADEFDAVETKLATAFDKIDEIDAGHTGGTAGQIPVKASSDPHEVTWTNQEDINSGGVIEEAGEIILKTKVVEIGDWDMDATASKSVSHGLSDISKIRSVSVIIRNDAGTLINNLNDVNTGSGTAVLKGGITGINSTLIGLFRATSQLYDSTDYNSTSYNRGWVTFVYEYEAGS